MKFVVICLLHLRLLVNLLSIGNGLNCLRQIWGFELHRLGDEQLDLLSNRIPVSFLCCFNTAGYSLDNCRLKWLTTSVILDDLSKQVCAHTTRFWDVTESLIESCHVFIHSAVVELVHHFDHCNVQEGDDWGEPVVLIQIKQVLDVRSSGFSFRNTVGSNRSWGRILNQGLHKSCIYLWNIKTSFRNQSNSNGIQSECCFSCLNCKHQSENAQ